MNMHIIFYKSNPYSINKSFLVIEVCSPKTEIGN